jgi:hypothetical protein
LIAIGNISRALSHQRKLKEHLSLSKSFGPISNIKKTVNQGISSLKPDGKLITDPIPKANVLNDQFKS